MKTRDCCFRKPFDAKRSDKGAVCLDVKTSDSVCRNFCVDGQHHAMLVRLRRAAISDVVCLSSELNRLLVIHALEFLAIRLWVCSRVHTILTYLVNRGHRLQSSVCFSRDYASGDSLVLGNTKTITRVANCAVGSYEICKSDAELIPSDNGGWDEVCNSDQGLLQVRGVYATGMFP